MHPLTTKLSIIAIAFLAISINVSSQELTGSQKAKITAEITTLFEKSIKAGERLDISGITENVSDTLSAGFIDNGLYYQSFAVLMKGFREGIRGLKSQKMEVLDKKITVLSDNAVLLTASGNYSADIEDGRVITGKFAWSFVYSRINSNWKVIHTHMSNLPR